MRQDSIATPPSVEERHEKGFNGIYIPWHIFELIELKKLKAVDVLMLCMIHSLCHKGQGCFASNAYLGKCIGVSEKRASENISKLRRLNLVVTTAYDGRRRTMQVSYNMNPTEIQRETPEKRGIRLPKNGGSDSRKTGDQTPEKRGERLEERLKERLEERNSLSEPKSSDRTNEVPFLSDEEQATITLSSKSNSPSYREKKKQPSSFDIKAANKFAEVVKSHRKVQKNSDLRQWANTFRQMRETDKVPEKDIREVITWYGKYIGGDFIPEAFSAATFRKKYAEGKFTAAMRRCSQDNGTSSNGGKRLTRENMWSDPENVLPGGILKTEVGQDGQKYDGQLLSRVRRRVLERFGQGLPLFRELQTVLDEEFPEVETLPVAIIGRVG